MGSGLGRDIAAQAERELGWDQQCCATARRSVGLAHGEACPWRQANAAEYGPPRPQGAGTARDFLFGVINTLTAEQDRAQTAADQRRAAAVEARQARDAAAGISEFYDDDPPPADVADDAVGVDILARYTILPMSVEGRGAVALLCARHTPTPVLLWPGTGKTPGSLLAGPPPVDQRGLRLDQFVDAALRHEYRRHP